MASFRNVYTALLLVVAKATNKELARYVSFLKAENQTLRARLPERLSLTTREKNRLVRFGRNIGSALNHICTIVHPDTLRRWIRESNKTGKKFKSKKVGRRRTEALIMKPSRKDRKTREPNTIRLSDIRCNERLGGLLKSYSQVAA